jgi:hypothetical protein
MSIMFQRSTIRHVFIAALLAGVLALALIGGSLAASNPSGTGQPNQSCGSAGATSMPNGFNTAGFSHAEEVYAGSGVSATTANSDHAVSQYDVACYQNTSNGH